MCRDMHCGVSQAAVMLSADMASIGSEQAWVSQRKFDPPGTSRVEVQQETQKQWACTGAQLTLLCWTCESAQDPAMSGQSRSHRF